MKEQELAFVLESLSDILGQAARRARRGDNPFQIMGACMLSVGDKMASYPSPPAAKAGVERLTIIRVDDN
jgi:hypothetical protein